MSKFDPLDGFKQYIALKHHFSSSYDYFKYNSKTKGTSKEDFLKRNDQSGFFKLSHVYTTDNLVPAIVANLLFNQNIWIGDIVSKDGQRRLETYQHIHQSLAYIFQQDLRTLFDSVPTPLDIFRVIDGQNPPVLSAFYSDEITRETFIILNDLRPFFNDISGKLNDPILWPKKRILLEKYHPFIKYSRDEFMGILMKVLKEYQKD